MSEKKKEKLPTNKGLNKFSILLCWSILCLGLGYAWAMAVYSGQENPSNAQIGYPEMEYPNKENSR